MTAPLANYDGMDDPSTFVPQHDRESIKLYIQHGLLPGSFLQAVISNDLREAIGQADHINIGYLPTIVAWFYQCAPAMCWGSRQKMQAWLRSNHSNKEPA